MLFFFIRINATERDIYIIVVSGDPICVELVRLAKIEYVIGMSRFLFIKKKRYICAVYIYLENEWKYGKDDKYTLKLNL